MNTNLTPNAISDLDVADLAALSATDLCVLQVQLAGDAKVLKARSEKLNAAIERRYAELARSAYLGAGKDTGTIHLNDAGHDIEVNVPKKVEWDQDVLRSVLDAMPVEQARHFAKVTFAVDERKFSAAIPDIQAALAAARTVKPGKMSITINERKAA